jgi:hypothetical protein
MARIIVATGPIGRTDDVAVPKDASVLLDERVEPVHLSEDHAARQLIERIAWAVSDADDAEHAP